MQTGIVLVGGEGRRAGGIEKYSLEFCGKTFIERLLDTLESVVDETIIVARDQNQCERLACFDDVVCVSDLEPGLGPIGGLQAGALTAHNEALFVVACDMPCINGEVIQALFDDLEDYDAVIPSWSKEMYEPLHAIYRRSSVLHYLKESASLSLRPLIRALNTRFVPVDSFRSLDPELLTFLNVNSLRDLERIRTKFEADEAARVQG